ncbi:MAG TPA: molybdopterin-binding protein [Bacteroidia bacterium]|nr:molybdopterin-binding protein [Bacteroidia bacterium]HRS58966.1 molybdopterin-binding protein [Bacteroidia bacterium]HRU67545.1 molybdopterin-binding protein [Bacteroidia bacterium]
MNGIKILSVNISEKKGTIKKPVSIIEINDQGVVGDAHAGFKNREISLLGIESFRKFEQSAGRKVAFGEFAENLTTEGMELFKTHPLDRFSNDSVELEVTQIGKKCHGDRCAIFREVGNCVMPVEGIFTRIIKGGKIKAGDFLEYHPKEFKILVITLSDRAAKGEYEDKSGPKVVEYLRQYFEEKERKYHIDTVIIPDHAKSLEILLDTAKKENIDLLITTGGTGIGPADITVDVVKPRLTKEIPGIMELIRFKYGQEKPQALVSRAVAGVMGQTLVFTLPGSVRGVSEYMDEILKSLEHLIYMLHSLDLH